MSVNNMKEISLVTAFYNIGREHFKAIPRTNDTYMNNFKFWCRLKNNLVVYTDSHHAEIIHNIREGYGLADKTTIVKIDKIDEIEPEIFKRMHAINENNWFEDFRILPNATSNIPDYSYLMMLKNWFLKDAVEKKIVSDTVAWIDFGFNHGGDLYTVPEEFDFCWKYDFSNKIHLFYYGELDKKPVFEIVRRLCDCFMGCLYILPDYYCNELWKLTRMSMMELNDMGLYDDDQLLLLMAYRKRPDIFEVHKSKWFMPLKEYGGSHLTIKVNKELKGIKYTVSKLSSSLDIKKKALKNSYITYKNLTSKW